MDSSQDAAWYRDNFVLGQLNSRWGANRQRIFNLMQTSNHLHLIASEIIWPKDGEQSPEFSIYGVKTPPFSKMRSQLEGTRRLFILYLWRMWYMKVQICVKGFFPPINKHYVTWDFLASWRAGAHQQAIEHTRWQMQHNVAPEQSLAYMQFAEWWPKPELRGILKGHEFEDRLFYEVYMRLRDARFSPLLDLDQSDYSTPSRFAFTSNKPIDSPKPIIVSSRLESNPIMVTKHNQTGSRSKKRTPEAHQRSKDARATARTMRNGKKKADKNDNRLKQIKINMNSDTSQNKSAANGNKSNSSDKASGPPSGQQRFPDAQPIDSGKNHESSRVQTTKSQAGTKDREAAVAYWRRFERFVPPEDWDPEYDPAQPNTPYTSRKQICFGDMDGES